MGTMLGGSACNPAASTGAGSPADKLPAPELDLPRALGSPVESKAVFAGGCFWCVEAVFEQLDGVTDVASGYSGGKEETADYKAVCSGTTDHAEVVRITYDPAKVTYGQLLRVFFATHDPTTKNRQGPDVGAQYRSAVFYAGEDEKKVAQAYIDQLTRARIFEGPIVTVLEPLDAFYEAEDYHQDYVRRNPDQPYVRAHALPKKEKARKTFPELLKN